MILSFGDKATEEFYHGISSSRAYRLLPQSLKAAAIRKLDLLNSAATVGELRIPPGNRLEKLKGDLDGMHSVRINQQYRVIFLWTEEGPEQVQIMDYH